MIVFFSLFLIHNRRHICVLCILGNSAVTFGYHNGLSALTSLMSPASTCLLCRLALSWILLKTRKIKLCFGFVGRRSRESIYLPLFANYIPMLSHSGFSVFRHLSIPWHDSWFEHLLGFDMLVQLA